MNVAGQTRTVARIVGKGSPAAPGQPAKPEPTKATATEQPVSTTEAFYVGAFVKSLVVGAKG